jgi:2-deoxystreptamine N-acetyl-D-glucosaminyltransferase/2-deoxystreptamine glucosyltransferase
VKPRVLIVGRSRYRLPLEPNLRRKFDALAEELDVRVLASGTGGDETFHLVAPRRLDGPRFWAALPLRIRREVRDFRPDAVLVQSPYEAMAAQLAGARPVILEVHGDWTTATRLYGSAARHALAPVLDRLALASVRRADAVRTISSYTTALVREAGAEPTATFPAFMDLDPFLGPVVPLPERPAALFVGVLERYKDVDGLAAAWRLAAPRLPGIPLRIVGKGSRARVVQGLVQSEWTPEAPNDAIPGMLDAATVLVLPSRSEGLGRIVVEALCRGRPVVATRVGGITDLVRDGENGLLVPYGDTEALAAAIERIVTDHELAVRLGAAAGADSAVWVSSPTEYAGRMRALIDTALAERR